MRQEMNMYRMWWFSQVISQTVVPAVTAPSLGEGLLTPTPPKRIPKRKMKGPGRGKKKQKLTPGPTSAPQVVDVDGVTQSSVSDGRADSEIQQENGADSNPANGEDTEMADGSAHDSSDDEGDDGEEGDDDQETSADPKSPSKLPQDVSAPSDIPPVADILATTESEIKQVEDVAIPPLLQVEELEVKAGSPLKNVALTTSTPTSPFDAATTELPLSPSIQPIEPVSDVTAPEIEVLNETMQSEMATTEPPIIPTPPPAPGVAETVAAAELLKEEKEEEEMLLGIVEESNNASESNDNDGVPSVTEPEDASNSEVVEAPPEEAVATKHDSPEVAAVETIPETAAPTADDEGDEDDGFPDLLGGLEKQLNDPVAETIQESEQVAPET
ncbi:hypothetical protein B0O99DRAFT_200993 [Bisporella sp. PMI_857]|nr:hypothetical protein B0O99DRAFT_200993 [Bisporella sp. PMI_857]